MSASRERLPPTCGQLNSPEHRCAARTACIEWSGTACRSRHLKQKGLVIPRGSSNGSVCDPSTRICTPCYPNKKRDIRCVASCGNGTNRTGKISITLRTYPCGTRMLLALSDRIGPIIERWRVRIIPVRWLDLVRHFPCCWKRSIEYLRRATTDFPNR